MCIYYSLTITATKKWAQIHLVFLWEIRSAVTHYSVLRFIKLNFIEVGNIRLLHKHATSLKLYISTQCYQYCRLKPNKINRQPICLLQIGRNQLLNILFLGGPSLNPEDSINKGKDFFLGKSCIT